MRARHLVALAGAAALVVSGLAAAPMALAGQTASNVVANCTDTKAKFHCLSLRRTDVKGHFSVNPNLNPSGYGPSDLRSAYKLPTTGGAGATVAIVDAYDD